MSTKRDYGVMGVTVIAVAAVLMIGMVYAAFTQNLSINGSATVQKTSWDIKFENLQTAVKTGTASEVTAPTLTATKVGDYAVTFKTPGDSISYTFDVTNDGSFDAEINSITIPTPTCSSSSSDTDASNVCSYLTYTLKYADGDAAAGNTVATGDELDSGVTRTMVLTLTYSSDVTADKLPTSGDVTISGLEIPIVYIQS